MVGGIFLDFVAARGWGMVSAVFSDFVAEIDREGLGNRGLGLFRFCGCEGVGSGGGSIFGFVAARGSEVEYFQILWLEFAARRWGVLGEVFSDFVAARGWGVVGGGFSVFVARIGCTRFGVWWVECFHIGRCRGAGDAIGIFSDFLAEIGCEGVGSGGWSVFTFCGCKGLGSAGGTIFKFRG